jgi:hypothetical protein
MLIRAQFDLEAFMFGTEARSIQRKQVYTQRLMAVAICLITLIFASSRHGWGQAITGTIEGTVRDQSGAVIANSTITVTNEATGTKSTRTTNDQGDYIAPFLPPGTYTVQVESSGFKSAVTSHVVVQVAQTSRVDLTMQPGKTSESVEVTAAAPQVQSTTSQLGEVIQHDQVETLPLNGRIFSQLVTLTPGAVQRGFADFGENPSAAGAVAPVNATVNGLPWSGNNYLLDGVANNEPLNQFINISPPLEAIQEFNVQTVNPTAEFGVFGGAIVNVTTRSGTNEYHGNVFEYMRNEALNAKTFFAQKKAPFKSHQFGGGLGGPIVRNRAFFFVDTQIFLQHTGNTNLFTVPTALQRTGNLSEENTQIFNPLTGQQFQGNIITGINPISLQVANLYPLPNLPGLSNNFNQNTVTVSDEQQFDAKTDFQLSSKDVLFVRESLAQRDFTTPAPGNRFLQGGSSSNSRNQNAVVGYTRTFSADKVLDVRVGFNRFAVTQLGSDFGVNKNNELGIPNGNIPGLPYTSGIARFNISGYRQTGSDGFLDSQRLANIYQYTANFTWIIGRHALKFGVDNRQIQSTLTNGQTAPRGEFDFDKNYTSNKGASGTGSSFASFLLGYPTKIFRDYINTRPHVRMRFTGLFLQDDYRFNDKLTLNLGLRWDVFTHPHDVDNHQSNFSLNDGLIHLATSSNTGPDVDTYYGSWAPRIGFAYSPDRGTTAFRAAYGISYFSDNFGATGGTLERNYPFFQTSQIAANNQFVPNLSVSQGLPANNPLVLTSPTIAPPPGFAVFMIPKNFRQDMAQMWNFGIQRALGNTASVEVTYVGTHGTHIFRNRDIDVPQPGPGSINPRRPYFNLNPNITSINYRAGDGSSVFHGLEGKLKKRFSAGLSALVSYTWSKSIDNVSNIFNPTNDKLNRGLSNNKAADIPQNFVVSASYELPFGPGKPYLSNPGSAIARALVGGWTLSDITSARSGEPLEIRVGSSLLNTGNYNRANVTCSHVSMPKKVTQWFDTNCFSAPAPFQFGNAGVGKVRGPGIFNTDFSLAKRTQFESSRMVEFRADFFNIFNQPHFANPTTSARSFGNADFGKISDTVLTARQIQLSLKLAF